MKIFEFNEKILIPLGLCADNVSHHKIGRFKKIQYFCTPMLFLIIFFCDAYMSAWYVLEHFDNFSKYNFALVTLGGAVSHIFSILSLYLHNNAVRRVIDDFQAIVNKSKRIFYFSRLNTKTTIIYFFLLFSVDRKEY